MNFHTESGVFDNSHDSLVFEGKHPIKVERTGVATINGHPVSDEELGKKFREWVKKYFEVAS